VSVNKELLIGMNSYSPARAELEKPNQDRDEKTDPTLERLKCWALDSSTSLNGQRTRQIRFEICYPRS
jgi:hypothetical protein